MYREREEDRKHQRDSQEMRAKSEYDGIIDDAGHNILSNELLRKTVFHLDNLNQEKRVGEE